MKIIDDLPNIYEKTMLKLIESYLRVYPKSLEISIWNDFANCIGINFNLVKELVEDSCKVKDVTKGYFDTKEVTNINCSEQSFSHEIFECVLNYYFIRKSLKEIKIDCSRTSLIENFKLYEIIAHYICMMNVNSGTYECMCNNTFSRKHAPQSFESFHPLNYIDWLNSYICSENFYDNNKRLLPILYNFINYQFITHSNAMILIVITQIMKHSAFLDNTTKSIAIELYNSIHIIMKDARVILIQPNYLYIDVLKEPSLRTKKTDNTTRLHIVYGYDNYDTYSLRLDFCHKGINWIHYNNQTPGGVKSFFFTKQEYEDIITKKPKMKKCFIFHNGIYFLKEKKNCELSNDDVMDFNDIEFSNIHSKAFCKNYAENDVIFFVTLLNDFFFNISCSTVDKSGRGSKYAFNLDFLMSMLYLFYLSNFLPSQYNANKIKSFIIDKAVNYGLIDSKDRTAYDSLEGLIMIIELAQERCKNLT